MDTPADEGCPADVVASCREKPPAQDDGIHHRTMQGSGFLIPIGYKPADGSTNAAVVSSFQGHAVSQQTAVVASIVGWSGGSAGAAAAAVAATASADDVITKMQIFVIILNEFPI